MSDISQVPVPSQPTVTTNPVFERRSYGSKISFSGVTSPAVGWVQHRATWWGQVLAGVGVGVYLLLAWTAILYWYFMIFIFFGLFTIPWKIVMRGRRKSLHMQEMQLALQAQMVQNTGGPVPPPTS